MDSASGELRRRNTGKTVDSGIEEPEKVGYDEEGEDAYKEGLKLYSQAEQSSFQDPNALAMSIQQMTKASERGVEEATVWMKGFLDSASALPLLPENLVKTMRSMMEATPTEKQVSLAAKSLFQKIAGGHNAISRKEISQKAKNLLESEDAATLKKSSRMLEYSISRLCNDALAINHTDEVGVTWFGFLNHSYSEFLLDVCVAYFVHLASDTIRHPSLSQYTHN